MNVTGIPSNFTFDSDDSKFYNVHEAQLIDEDSLILMDDGNNRPGCKAPEGTNCFSRALEYHLDFEKMEATLVWQASGFPRQTSNLKHHTPPPSPPEHTRTRVRFGLFVFLFGQARQAVGVTCSYCTGAAAVCRTRCPKRGVYHNKHTKA